MRFLFIKKKILNIDIDSYLDFLKVTFPTFVTVVEIGNSTEGRPIRAVKLHQEGGRENKKAIFLDAGTFFFLSLLLNLSHNHKLSTGIHAREWISPATITYMIREIVEGGDKYDCLLSNFDFFFVPVINPGTKKKYIFFYTMFYNTYPLFTYRWLRVLTHAQSNVEEDSLSAR